MSGTKSEAAMNFDDLLVAYQDTFTRNEVEQRRMNDGFEYMVAHRAGIRCIMEAMRDSVVLNIDAHKGIGILATETAIDATRNVFNAILGE